jgi:hypothetical protein
LPPATYADIVAHILEVNGFRPGNTALQADDALLNRMELK